MGRLSAFSPFICSSVYPFARFTPNRYASLGVIHVHLLAEMLQDILLRICNPLIQYQKLNPFILDEIRA
jgi:hypothetical protein